jgi:hypothetical protein
MLDWPLAVAVATSVMVYSLPTVREYAGSLNTAGLWETDRKVSAGEVVDLPGFCVSTV